MFKDHQFIFLRHDIFGSIDALHVIDASAHFDRWWSGRYKFYTPSKFNVQSDAPATFITGHTTHNLFIDAWRLIKEIRYLEMMFHVEQLQ